MVVAGAIVIAGGFSQVQPAAAQPAPFIPRPTQPLDCRSAAGAPDLWSGHFFGRKEVDRGFIRTLTTNEHACFLGRTDCENWLYNMQSEYTVMVWRAECVPGLG